MSETDAQLAEMLREMTPHLYTQGLHGYIERVSLAAQRLEAREVSEATKNEAFSAGAKIIRGLEEAARGNFTRVTIGDQVWVREAREVSEAMVERVAKALFDLSKGETDSRRWAEVEFKEYWRHKARAVLEAAKDEL